MTANPADDSPDPATDLVRRINDPAASAEQRQQAKDELAPLLLTMAGQVTARMRVHDGEELAADALVKIWSILDRFDPRAARFGAWFAVIVRHEVLGRLRREKSRRAWEAKAPPPASNDFWTDRVEVWRQRFVRLRELLDLIVWTPSQENHVHRYAVLLLHLRQAMCLHAARQTDASDIEGGLSAFIEAVLLPWRPHEQAVRLRDGLPTLSDVWRGLRERVDQLPHRIESEHVCEQIEMLAQGTRLAPLLWNQWVTRAKRQANEKADARGVGDEWRELVANLLRNHPRD